MSKTKAVRRLENYRGSARDENAQKQATKHETARMVRRGELLSALVPRPGRR